MAFTQGRAKIRGKAHQNLAEADRLEAGGSDPKNWKVEYWSLTTLREKLVKIGAKVVSHGRYVTFQLAGVAVPRELFRKILSLIDDLRPGPAPA